MRKALIAALAAFAGMGAMAHAADIHTGGSMKDEPVVYAMPASWTGIYIGAGVGAGSSVTDLTFEGPRVGAGFDGIGGEGALGTLQLGYDRQLSPRFVIGAFLDYDFSGITTDADLSAGGFSADAEIELDHMWTLGARLGFLSSPNTLIYGLVGYTWGEYSLDAGFSFDFDRPTLAAVDSGRGYDSGDGFGADFDVEGWTVGAGIETMLTDNLSIKGEYRFTQFDEEGIFEFGPYGLDAEPSVHTARAVLSYRINPFERSLETYK